MQDILSILKQDDYEYIIDLIDGAAVKSSAQLRQAFGQWREDNTAQRKNELDTLLSDAIRQLGSYEIAFQLCFVTFADAGLPLNQIVQHVARSLRLKVAPSATEKELLLSLVRQYAAKPFRRQEVLIRLEAEKENSKIVAIVLYLGLCLLSNDEAAACPE